MRRDSIGQTFKVATLLCLVCSFIVSLSAVLLRPRQEANRERERKKNILIAAGLFGDENRNSDVKRLFEQVETRIVNLDEGTFNTDINPEEFNQLEEATKEGERLPPEQDTAGIKRKEQHSFVYLVRKKGRLDQIVLPIRGYGLWSTLYGFIALDAQSLRQGADDVVVRGLTFYQHAETPGLGGEVDNPRWKAKWRGKKVYDENWNVELKVTKAADSKYEVDALSGATITSQGVTNMMKFWLGDQGFKLFLEKQREEIAQRRPVGDAHG